MRAVSLRRGFQAIIVAVGILGCKDDGPTTIISPDGGTVASVLIIGAPTTPVMVGSEIQLAATALNETGSTLTNRTVTWKSSDVEVATVSTGGLVTAVGAGPVKITATSGGKEGSVSFDLRAGGAVGTAGDTLSMLAGKLVLIVPAGSLMETTTLMLAPVTSVPASPLLVAKSAFKLEPERQYFRYGARLSIGYDKANVPAGISPTTLQLYGLTEGAWVQIRGSTVDTTAQLVTGWIPGGGVYAIMSTAVDRLTLAGGTSGGGLYVGQTRQLTAVAYDAENTVLSNRIVTWSTSDASKATVSGTGLVTGVALGNVTITATSEGKTASTSMSVLARPTSDWSAVTEWTMFQGNAKHTGYVPVTADPGVFTEKWVTSPLGSGALNPVTTANGRVFVSTRSYFGSQKMAALSAATGAQQWLKDFGGIHGAHPPAYANNTVYITTSGHQDSFLWAFDDATGVLRFRSAYGNQWSSYYAPVIVGDAVYMAGGYYGGAYSFSATDGAQRWFAQTGQYDEWTPAVADGLVYTYTGGTNKVSAKSAATGAEVFAIEDPSFDWSGYQMGQGMVLGGSNNLLATNGGRLISFDLTARTIGWTQKASFGGNVTVAAGIVYVINSGQIDFRRESDGSLIGPWVPPTGSVQGPTIVTNNLLFASTATHTYAVDLASRQHIWSYPAGGHLALSSQGILFIAQANGKLAAIALK